MYVCLRPYIPLREEASDRAQMLTQLLFGERYRILESNEHWHLIETLFDSYRGYIYCRHPDQYLSSEEVMWISLTAKTSIKERSSGAKMLLGPGCFLSESLSTRYQVKSEDWKLITTPTDYRLYQLAMSFHGSPYLWGGRSIHGIDCSGLTQACLKIKGIKVPRDSGPQEKEGIKVEFGGHQPDDLAFFQKNGKIYHTGILMPDNKIIHASEWVKIDQFTAEGIVSDRGELTHPLHSIKRISS